MKRKITELEQLLIKNNYQLVLKTYGGKDSKETKHYFYQNNNGVNRITLMLNKYRNKIEDIQVNGINTDELEQIAYTFESVIKEYNNYIDNGD